MSWMLSTKRRLVQAVSLVALNTNFWGMGAETVCIPVMNCEACVWAWMGCPIGMLGRHLFFQEWPIFVLVSTLVLGALLGRLFCGWICPMGFLQDMLHKIPSKKFKLHGWTKWIKYAFLLLTVLVAGYFFGQESSYFFCSICPTAAIQVVIPEILMYQDFTLNLGRSIQLGVLVVVLILSLVVHRGFCKVMCPIGALIAITNKFSLLSLKLNKHSCISCGKCDTKCPMDVEVMDSPEKTGRAINRNTECIECLTCEQACPVTAINNNSHILKK